MMGSFNCKNIGFLFDSASCICCIWVLFPRMVWLDLVVTQSGSMKGGGGSGVEGRRESDGEMQK